jgi:putative ABC transport system substrate-binding protein
VRPGAISRRQFVAGAGAAGLGLLAGCGRWPGQAQEPARATRIGWLHFGLRDNYTQTQVDAFREGLREHGYVEGQNLELEFRWAEG